MDVEAYLVRWLGTTGLPSQVMVPQVLVTAVGQNPRPWLGASWAAKLPRLGRAARNTFAPVSEPRGTS